MNFLCFIDKKFAISSRLEDDNAKIHLQGSDLNTAFATELGDFIADSRIDIWIYGHSHTNIDTIISNTKIISNQMGYIFANEHLRNGFDASKFIEL